jgi:hypothetical protein
MSNNNTGLPKLLEPALPGSWIAEHHRIWQMKLLDANKLASFSHDRGESYFNETDVIQLWQLGLIKADLIISRRKLHLVGLTDRGTDLYGNHLYSDERRLPRRQTGWENARKTLKPLQKGIELLFHPFRFYVLYHISQMLDLHASSMQMFLQENYPRLLEISLTMFNNFSRSDKFITSINTWNVVASLAIITEPCFYERIFHLIGVSLSSIRNIDNWRMQIRQELCFSTQMLDRNRWIHTLLCLGDSKLRLELEGNLGGALLLRTMAEMLRRATEEAFDDRTLQEEDELGFGWVPKDVKEKLYGSNRLLDNHQAAETFARRHGLNYKPRVHLYGEGNTEYGALSSFFKSMGVPVTNLHGLMRVKEGKSKAEKSMVPFFSDSLRADIQDHLYSMVIIDKDVDDNVRILESAARNNSTSESDGLFGRFFLSHPDFEFANFDVEELEEVLWKWVGGEGPSQEGRKLLHSHVKDATNSTEFFNGVKHAARSLLQLYGYDKCEEWGVELMMFAWEHQLKKSQKRQIIEAVELALYWEKTIHLELYETAKKTYRVDPQTGELVNRSNANPQIAGL